MTRMVCLAHREAHLSHLHRVLLFYLCVILALSSGTLNRERLIAAVI